MQRIALIDDHAFFRQGVAAALSAKGHEVLCSIGDGREAVSAIQQSHADVVLLDQRMSPIDGATILSQLREQGDLRPVIMLTNELSDTELVRLLKSKVNGIVLKHYPEERLLDAINAVCSGHLYLEGDLIEHALKSSAQVAHEEAADCLTHRERTVAALAGQGLRNRQIGERLNMTEGTVKFYLHNIYRKLGVANRTQLSLALSSEEG